MIYYDDYGYENYNDVIENHLNSKIWLETKIADLKELFPFYKKTQKQHLKRIKEIEEWLKLLQKKSKKEENDWEQIIKLKEELHEETMFYIWELANEYRDIAKIKIYLKALDTFFLKEPKLIEPEVDSKAWFELQIKDLETIENPDMTEEAEYFINAYQEQLKKMAKINHN